MMTMMTTCAHVVVIHPPHDADWPLDSGFAPRVAGVYATEAEARLAAVRLAVGSIVASHYDPSRRFRPLGNARWLDVWRREEGCATAFVETWAVGQQQQRRASSVAAVYLDAAIKAHIDASGLSPARVREMLAGWRAGEQPPAHVLDAGVGSFCRAAGYAPPDREAWEARFGAAE